MKTLLLPLVLLILGLGGGVGAGLALAPPEEGGATAACAAPAEAGEAEGGGGEAEAPEGASEAEGPAACGEAAEEPAAEGAQGEGEGEGAAGGSEGGEAAEGGHDYVKLPNQFVVPVVEGGEVAALVLVSLSVEVPAGAKEEIALIEPKLRDAFLRVLFDHANTGGFEGMFTASGAMRPLRAALLAGAEEASEGLVTDVLIVEMVREDR